MRRTFLYLSLISYFLCPRPYAFSVEGWIQDGTGKVVGSVPYEGLAKGVHGEFLHAKHPDGSFETQDEKQHRDGHYTPPGFISPNDVPAASYEQDGMIRNKKGHVIGEVSRDGVVMTVDGKIIASMPSTAIGRATGAIILVKTLQNQRTIDKY